MPDSLSPNHRTEVNLKQLQEELVKTPVTEGSLSVAATGSYSHSSGLGEGTAGASAPQQQELTATPLVLLTCTQAPAPRGSLPSWAQLTCLHRTVSQLRVPESCVTPTS